MRTYAQRVDAGAFTLETATVDSINAAFDAGTLTSEKLVSLYLARIAAYENNGPNINAFTSIQPIRSPLRGRWMRSVVRRDGGARCMGYQSL